MQSKDTTYERPKIPTMEQMMADIENIRHDDAVFSIPKEQEPPKNPDTKSDGRSNKTSVTVTVQRVKDDTVGK